MGERAFDFYDLLDILRKRFKVILICTVISVLISILSCFIVPPKYKANTKLFIGKSNSISTEENKSEYDSNDVQMYERIIVTYADVLKTKTLIDKALVNLKREITSEQVIKNLDVTPKANTEILEISYVDKDPEEAQEVLNSIIKEFIDCSKNLIPNSDVKVIENIYLPREPVSPNKVLYITGGFLIGVILGLILALVMEYMNKTFHSKNQVEEETGLPVIGYIPNFYDV